MEMCACPSLSPLPSSSPSSSSFSFAFGASAETVGEFCSFAVSAVISHLFYAIFTFFFAVVGATLGAMTGGLIVLRTEKGFFHGAAVGATSGAVFFIEVFRSSLVLWHSDDSGIECLLSLVTIISDSGYAKRSSVEKIPKIRITAKNILDTSGHRLSCSVCLQDFQLGDMVRSWPHCHHKFHLPCIDEWIIRHGSCPLCRRGL